MDVRGVALVYFRTRNNKISPSQRPAVPLLHNNLLELRVLKLCFIVLNT